MILTMSQIKTVMMMIQMKYLIRLLVTNFNKKKVMDLVNLL